MTTVRFLFILMSLFTLRCAGGTQLEGTASTLSKPQFSEWIYHVSGKDVVKILSYLGFTNLKGDELVQVPEDARIWHVLDAIYWNNGKFNSAIAIASRYSGGAVNRFQGGLKIGYSYATPREVYAALEAYFNGLSASDLPLLLDKALGLVTAEQQEKRKSILSLRTIKPGDYTAGDDGAFLKAFTKESHTVNGNNGLGITSVVPMIQLQWRNNYNAKITAVSFPSQGRLVKVTVPSAPVGNGDTLQVNVSKDTPTELNFVGLPVVFGKVGMLTPKQHSLINNKSVISFSSSLSFLSGLRPTTLQLNAKSGGTSCSLPTGVALKIDSINEDRVTLAKNYLPSSQGSSTLPCSFNLLSAEVHIESTGFAGIVKSQEITSTTSSFTIELQEETPMSAITSGQILTFATPLDALLSEPMRLSEGSAPQQVSLRQIVQNHIDRKLGVAFFVTNMAYIPIGESVLTRCISDHDCFQDMGRIRYDRVKKTLEVIYDNYLAQIKNSLNQPIPEGAFEGAFLDVENSYTINKLTPEVRADIVRRALIDGKDTEIGFSIDKLNDLSSVSGVSNEIYALSSRQWSFNAHMFNTNASVPKELIASLFTKYFGGNALDSAGKPFFKMATFQSGYSAPSSVSRQKTHKEDDAPIGVKRPIGTMGTGLASVATVCEKIQKIMLWDDSGYSGTYVTPPCPDGDAGLLERLWTGISLNWLSQQEAIRASSGPYAPVIYGDKIPFLGDWVKTVKVNDAVISREARPQYYETMLTGLMASNTDRIYMGGEDEDGIPGASLDDTGVDKLLREYSIFMGERKRNPLPSPQDTVEPWKNEVLMSRVEVDRYTKWRITPKFGFKDSRILLRQCERGVRLLKLDGTALTVIKEFPGARIYVPTGGSIATEGWYVNQDYLDPNYGASDLGTCALMKLKN